jgi:hypothetical protein
MKNIEFKPARITHALWKDPTFDITTFAADAFERQFRWSIEDRADMIRAADKVTVTFTIEVMDGDL